MSVEQAKGAISDPYCGKVLSLKSFKHSITSIAGGGTTNDKSITRMVQWFKANYFNGVGTLLGAIRAFQTESHSELLQVMRSFLLASAL